MNLRNRIKRIEQKQTASPPDVIVQVGEDKIDHAGLIVYQVDTPEAAEQIEAVLRGE